jgi:DNA adenine methylase
MKYFGSKYRLSKKITEIIKQHLKETDFSADLYVEPFCGIATIFQNLSLDFESSILNDKNESLMLLLAEIKNGNTPNVNITKEIWEKYKNDPTPSALKCICQYGNSFNNFSSYLYDNGSSYRTLKILEKPLQKAILMNLDSKDFFKFLVRGQWPLIRGQWPLIRGQWPLGNTFTGNIIIYMDPPYTDCKTNKRSYGSNFDHDEFYESVRQLPKNMRVYISNNSAPEDFECIWTLERESSMKTSKNGTKKIIIEKIFVYN